MFVTVKFVTFEMPFLSMPTNVLCVGREMRFQDVSFLPSRSCFYTTFRKIVVEVKASGMPHLLEMRLGASKSMLPVKCLCSN